MELIICENMLKSTNITLRATEPKDIDLIFDWENNTDIWRVSNTNTPYSRFVIEQYVLNSTQYIFSAKQLRLMIDLNEIKKTIGTIDLFDYEPINRRAGVGILILNEFRNKGYAFECLKIIEIYTKKILNLHQLYCNISENNLISIKLFEKAGFISTGRKKDWLFNSDGNFIDELFYQKFL